MKHIKRFKELLIDRPLEEVENALDQGKPGQAMEKAVPLLAAGLVTVVVLVLVLVLVITALRSIWKRIAAPVLIAVVIAASYYENRKTPVESAVAKKPTMTQYITVGSIVKMAAKRIAPILELSPIYEETDIKAAKDERIVPHGRCWLFKYRFLKKSIATIIDTDIAAQAFQNEIQTVLDNDNPAGYDVVRCVYGGVEESVLQVDHMSQNKTYLYLYCCYASNEYFDLREQERKDEHDDTADTEDFEF